MKSYLIVGNGVAGTSAAEAIRKLDEKGSITMVTDEDISFYYRIRLNDYISGDLKEKDLIVRKEEWYRGQGIDLKLGTRIVGAEPSERVLITTDGERITYHSLLLATGSHAFVPPIKGAERKGSLSLRTIKDAREIFTRAQNVGEAILIGGGLLGLEAGNALRKLGKKVTVVEFFPRLLPRQLDVEGARRLQSIMEGMGFAFRLGAKTQEITGDALVTGVLLEGGEELSAGMVIISAGVRPNLELAESLSLDCDKGIKVDEHLQTNQPDIYAAGDVAEFRGMPYGIWPAAMEQGKIAGTNMAGGEITYEGTTMANTLKVVGIDLASAGNIDAENKYESRVVTNETVYKKIVIEDGHIIGCIMLGDTKGFSRITKAMAEKADVSQVEDLISTD